jgi:hypothetical protein
MINQKNHAPRRYCVDAHGRRVLIGLSPEETAEFESLEDTSAMESGSPTSVGGIPLKVQEARWLELYAKHDIAWKAWIAQSRTEYARI